MLVRLGIPDDFRPLAWLDRHGDAHGQAVDILKERLEQHVSLAWARFSHAKLADALDNGLIDAIAIRGQSGNRAAAGMSQPYMVSGASLFRRQAAMETDPWSRVATPGKGPLVLLLERLAPRPQILSTSSYREALDWLIEGRVDRVALNHDVGCALVKAAYTGDIAIPVRPAWHVPLALQAHQWVAPTLLPLLARTP